MPRTTVWDEAQVSSSDKLLTTGEAARLLGVSRQHVVDLCDRGDLEAITTGVHRRVRRSDVEAFRAQTGRMTRDQRRSLWIGHAVAGKLVMAPDEVVKTARHNLVALQARHPRGQGARWLREWERLLEGPVEEILGVLASPTPRARELRQNSPFAGVLSTSERESVLRSFGELSRSQEHWGAA